MVCVSVCLCQSHKYCFSFSQFFLHIFFFFVNLILLSIDLRFYRFLNSFWFYIVWCGVLLWFGQKSFFCIYNLHSWCLHVNMFHLSQFQRRFTKWFCFNWFRSYLYELEINALMSFFFFFWNFELKFKFELHWARTCWDTRNISIAS